MAVLANRGHGENGARQGNCCGNLERVLVAGDEASGASGVPGTPVAEAATIAPMTAIPSEPPTWRPLFRTAEPTPALSTGTEPMAAAVIGVITIAMPKPPMRSPGRMSQKFEVASSREKMSSEIERSSIPPATSQREPTRSEYFPAMGATRMIRTVIGRKDAPVWTAEKPSTFWMKSEL